MGRSQILEKLSQKLVSIPKSEEDVVWVLSRIRKILEIDNHPDKYQILNFYCNLSLHSKISTPPKIVKEKLQKIADGLDYGHSIIGFGDLQNQLLIFFTEYNLPNFYAKSTSQERSHLHKVLLSIYQETPILISYRDTKYKVVVDAKEIISFDPV